MGNGYRLPVRSPRSQALTLFALVSLAGCGGGGGGHASSPSKVGAVVKIAWPARARDFASPTAATAATITLSGAGVTGADVVQTIERPTDPAAVTTTTTLAQAVRPGTFLLRIDFGADRGALGTPLATAAVNVRVNADGSLVRADGTPLGTVGFASNVQSVGLATDQTVQVGGTLRPAVTVLTKDNAIVPVTADSATFAVASGGDRLRANPDGTLTGLAEGAATVVATVDGISGVPVAVSVVPASLATRTVAAANSAFVYDATRSRFWLAVPPTDSNGNSVRSLDPGTGTLGAPIFVGANPTVLAISDDGSTLYAGLYGANAVRRVDLTTATANLQFSLPASGFNAVTYALDLAVQPGHPGTVAATLQDVNDSGSNGPTVFDDGVARPNRLGVYEGTRLAWTAADRIVAVNVGFSPTEDYLASVDAQGATKILTTQGGVAGSSAGFVFAGGRLYDANGFIADATTLARVGTFALGNDGFGFSTSVGPAIDIAANRAYFIQTANGVARVRAFRLDTFLAAGSRALADYTPPSGFGTSVDGHLFRWGAKGLAFSTGDGIVLIDDVSGL